MSGSDKLIALRPYGVFDGAGEQLGLFASWAVAHEWGHIAARMPGTVLPVEVEDRSARTTQRITAEVCHRIHWAPAGTTWGCALPRSREDGTETPARAT